MSMSGDWLALLFCIQGVPRVDVSGVGVAVRIEAISVYRRRTILIQCSEQRH